MVQLGGGGSVIADGGYSSRGASAQIETQIQMALIQKAIESMPSPIVRVSDINRVSMNQYQAVKVTTL
jgi:hypothetical protein